MAFKFNAILKFSGAAAAAGIGRVGKKFERLKVQAASAGAAMSKINQGIRGAAIATAPFAIGVAFATKMAADFEAQMSVVKSVILGTDAEMKLLNATTKRLGATTAFTATQAGEGAEFLARAGFSAEQIVSALPGVLDAAAASGVELGEAADVVASQLGAFGLAAEDAGTVADALSLTTALTNTNFSQLSEAMKRGAPAAKFAGFTLSETASAMGVMANAGIKGSLAGTALKNALAKLAKPSKTAVELFGGRQGMDKALLRIVDGQKKLKPLEVIMANITKVIRKSKNPLESTRKAFEILGLRGSVAFSAFSSAIGKETKVTEKNLASLRRGIEISGEGIKVSVGDTLPSLVALRLQIAGAEGTARKMAAIRLDNLNGQFVLFKSALEGLSIEMGSLVTGPLQGLVKTATDAFSVFAIGFQAAAQGGKATGKQLDALSGNQFKDMLSFAIEFAQGFKEGFAEVKASAKEVFASINEFLKPIIGESALTAKEIGKIAIKIIAVGAIAAPILASIAAAFFVLGPIILGITGVIQLMGVVFSVVASIAIPILTGIGFVIGLILSPIGLVVAAIIGVIAAVVIWRNEIVSFGKSAFIAVTGLLSALNAPFVAFGNFLLNVLTFPIRTFLSLLIGAVSSISNLLGDSLLSKFGLSKAGIKSFLTGVDTAKSALTFGKDTNIQDRGFAKNVTNIGEESNKLAREATINQQIVQPPSAKQIAQAQIVQSAVAGSMQGPPAPVSGTIKVVVEGRIRGKDINLIQTREAISQSERNGRQLQPETKRRLMQNGAMATGV